MADDRYPELGTTGLLARWNAWSGHATWTHMLAEFESKGDEKQAAVARDALADVEAVSPLDALAANEELTRLLTGWRWLAMRSARESGATWEQIGGRAGHDPAGREGCLPLQDREPGAVCARPIHRGRAPGVPGTP
jgi:hypothetical protein